MIKEYRDNNPFRMKNKVEVKQKEVNRAISTYRLQTSRFLHLRPINLVVFKGPQENPNL